MHAGKHEKATAAARARSASQQQENRSSTTLPSTSNDEHSQPMATDNVPQANKPAMAVATGSNMQVDEQSGQFSSPVRAQDSFQSLQAAWPLDSLQPTTPRHHQCSTLPVPDVQNRLPSTSSFSNMITSDSNGVSSIIVTDSGLPHAAASLRPEPSRLNKFSVSEAARSIFPIPPTSSNPTAVDHSGSTVSNNNVAVATNDVSSNSSACRTSNSASLLATNNQCRALAGSKAVGGPPAIGARTSSFSKQQQPRKLTSAQPVVSASRQPSEEALVSSYTHYCAPRTTTNSVAGTNNTRHSSVAFGSKRQSSVLLSAPTTHSGVGVAGANAVVPMQISYLDARNTLSRASMESIREISDDDESDDDDLEDGKRKDHHRRRHSPRKSLAPRDNDAAEMRTVNLASLLQAPPAD